MAGFELRGFEEVQAQLRALGNDQIPYATMLAINKTAFALIDPSKKQMESRFDRPTPLIYGAARVLKATKETLSATFYIDPKRAVIIRAHELGGERGLSSFEKKLGLTDPWRAVPTKKMPLNQYGNPDSALKRRILTAKSGKARGIYFVMPGTRSKQSPGIYQFMSSTQIIKLFHFVNRMTYSPRLDWVKALSDESRRLLPGFTMEAIDRAIATAR